MVFILASALPLALLGLRMLLVRRLGGGWRLGLDLMLLVASVPMAIEAIGWALKFPENPGDHSPGIGVAFMPLGFVWLFCALVWVGRLCWFAARKFAPVR